MIEVAFPADQDVPALVGSFAACLASVTEKPVTEIPQPKTDLHGAMAYWRSWLASRGAGLVPIAEPGRFNWPGYWIAVLADDAADDTAAGTAVLMFGTPSGVVLSPQDAALLGSAAADLPVRDGYALASLDPVLTSPAAPRPGCVGKWKRSRWLNARPVRCG